MIAWGVCARAYDDAIALAQLDHVKGEVKELEPKVKQLEKSSGKLQAQIDEITKALDAAKVGRVSWCLGVDRWGARKVFGGDGRARLRADGGAHALRTERL